MFAREKTISGGKSASFRVLYGERGVSYSPYWMGMFGGSLGPKGRVNNLQIVRETIVLPVNSDGAHLGSC